MFAVSCLSKLMERKSRVERAQKGGDWRQFGCQQLLCRFKINLLEPNTARQPGHAHEIMAPPTKENPEAEARQELIEQLNVHTIPRPFRNPHWKSNPRRNKNIKTILGDAVRKESSLMPTQDNSGAATPMQDESALSSDGATTPAVLIEASTPQPNLAQASRNLSKLVLERNMKSNGFSSAPSATYTNIESAPSLAHSKRYCDVTGLPAPYTDPKTRLRYHNMEVFGVIRTLGQGVAESYLEARGAHTVLK